MENKALITNIQRFSLTDGPGIRTTVFFQGCNMHCLWCHNPETLPLKPTLLHYENKCIGCGKCIETCLNHAHAIYDGKHIINRNKCISCGECASKCYAGALVMSSKYYTVEEVMEEVIQDKIYYDESDGGVTLSGGESSLHTTFVSQLADECCAQGINIAIETNMSRPFKDISEILKKMNLIMCDLKIFNNELHEKWTGIGNKTIITNIEKASHLGIPIIVRTPLIPGATDSIDNINNIISFLSKLNNIKRYEILNFNPLGSGKYKALSKDNLFEEAKPYSKHILEELQQLLSIDSIEIKIV